MRLRSQAHDSKLLRSTVKNLKGLRKASPFQSQIDTRTWLAHMMPNAATEMQWGNTASWSSYGHAETLVTAMQTIFFPCSCSLLISLLVRNLLTSAAVDSRS